MLACLLACCVSHSCVLLFSLGLSCGTDGDVGVDMEVEEIDGSPVQLFNDGVPLGAGAGIVGEEGPGECCVCLSTCEHTWRRIPSGVLVA